MRTFHAPLMVLTLILSSNSMADGRVPSGNREPARVSHAKELLGSSFHRSVVKTAVTQQNSNIQESLVALAEKRLPEKFRKHSQDLAKAIVEEADKGGFDPMFLVAVIETESGFRPNARGTSGEIGLMQILPNTAKWIAKRSHIGWKGNKSLLDPVTNVRLGAAYFTFLRDQFDAHSQLYIAAYNMGIKNVQRNLERKNMPRAYPSRVMGHYVRLYTELARNES